MSIFSAFSAIAPIFGGALSYLGQRETNAENVHLGHDQMSFQREMSSTAYQRAVQDMQLAGLNPMLAYQQGGASTPGGAMPVVGNSLGAGVQGAIASAGAAAEIEKKQAETENVRADTKKKGVEVANIEADTNVKNHTAMKINWEVNLINSNISHVNQQIDNAKVAGEKLKHSVEREQWEAARSQWAAKLLKFDYENMADEQFRQITITNALLGMQIPGASASEERDKTWFGQHIRPYIRDIFGRGVLSPMR